MAAKPIRRATLGVLSCRQVGRCDYFCCALISLRCRLMFVIFLFRSLLMRNLWHVSDHRALELTMETGLCWATAAQCNLAMLVSLGNSSSCDSGLCQRGCAGQSTVALLAEHHRATHQRREHVSWRHSIGNLHCSVRTCFKFQSLRWRASTSA